jgi:hypothetical protein
MLGKRRFDRNHIPFGTQMHRSELFGWLTTSNAIQSPPETVRAATAAAIGREPTDNEIGLFALALSGSMDALAPLLPFFHDAEWSLTLTPKGFVAVASGGRAKTSAGGKTPGLALITAIFRLWSLSRVH